MPTTETARTTGIRKKLRCDSFEKKRGKGMSRIRTVFLGTPDIAAFCLEKMLSDEHFEIVGVITQPDRPAGRSMKVQPTPVKAVAVKHNLPILQVEKLRAQENLLQLKLWNAECAVVVAFGQILSQDFLDLFPQRVVNVHASLLPRWRGAAPIQRAVMAGDPETGVALQVMTKKLDAGDILGVRRIAISETTTALELYSAMMPLAADLLHIELMDYMRGHLAAVPQDPAQVTLAPKIEKAEGRINWQRPAIEISRLVRGMTLGPGTWTEREGQRLKIVRVTVVPLPLNSNSAAMAMAADVGIGTVVAEDGDSFTVACGEQTALRVHEVQPESKARMSAKDFLRGYGLKVGEKV